VERGFGSDNFSPVHPKILAALQAANVGHTHAYGNDAYTARAVQMFQERFGPESAVHFVFNGTAANLLSMRPFVEPFSAVICSDLAHIHCDEGGAPEQLLGCKLLTVPHKSGKIEVAGVERWISWQGNEHHAQPRIISVSQSTELGTVYTPDELRVLASFAHDHGMYLHVDGARLGNALVHLGCSVHELLVETGVDVVSFGGTKNGMMFGEAVIFPKGQLARRFPFFRKNMAQLFSKMRYISAQFCAALEDDLWLETARQANVMAALLGRELAAIPGFELAAPVEANGVFLKIPKSLIEPMQEFSFFYVWDETASVIRLMVSFDVTESDVRRFVESVRRLVVERESVPLNR
jgi:threonine aldolase